MRAVPRARTARVSHEIEFERWWSLWVGRSFARSIVGLFVWERIEHSGRYNKKQKQRAKMLFDAAEFAAPESNGNCCMHFCRFVVYCCLVEGNPHSIFGGGTCVDGNVDPQHLLVFSVGVTQHQELSVATFRM